jgi:hypothetical protein
MLQNCAFDSNAADRGGQMFRENSRQISTNKKFQIRLLGHI